MTRNDRRITAAELLAGLRTSPDAYPQKLDLARESFLVVELDAAAYRAASFLDDRILGPATRGGWLPFDRVLDAAAALREPRPLHYILHTGHVGSTLLSRLLDETGCVLPLREPLPLRSLADAQDELTSPDSLLAASRFEALLEAQLRLWARGYRDTRAVVLKATSSAARLAPELLARRPDSRAVYLNLQAEPALATLLAGANSGADLRGHGPGRVRRLRARIGGPLPALHTLSPGELAAVSWLAESLCRRQLLQHLPGQVLGVDFDAFLADVPAQLARILAHLGIAAGPAELAVLAASPVLARYSKAPEHAYGPEVRGRLLAEARHNHAAEIGRGLGLLAGLARENSVVAELLAEPA